jgi:hypothetical protein
MTNYQQNFHVATSDRYQSSKRYIAHVNAVKQVNNTHLVTET